MLGQPRGRIGDPPDDQLSVDRRPAPVVPHRLEPVIVALLALDVPVGAGADRMERRLVLADRLDVLLRGDVLVADELGEVRGDFPDAVLEVHHDRVLVGRLDPLEVGAEERRRSARHVGPQILLDGELDVLGRHLAEAFVELHARAELERPRPELVRRLPFRRQPRHVPERLRVAHDQRVVHAVPQRLFRLAGAPGKRGLDAPLADGHDEPVTGADA